MPRAVAKTGSEADQQVGYSTNLEYLTDELRRLDLLIHLRLLEDRSREPSNPLTQFKGLVLLEEEIAALVNDAAGAAADVNSTAPPDSRAQTVAETLTRLEHRIQLRRAASLAGEIYLPLPRLSELFHLTRFEEECLIVCFAVEIDRKYEKLYAYLQDDVTRKKASVDLLLSLLCDSAEERINARQTFSSQTPLLKYRLLHLSDNPSDQRSPMLSRSLKLDDRIVNFLMGFEQLDARLERVARLSPTQADAESLAVDEATRSRINAFVASYFNDAKKAGHNLVLYFCGPYGSGRRALSRAVCHDLGLSLIASDAGKMLGAETPFEELMWLLGRETLLHGAALCLENFDSLVGGDGQQARLTALGDVIGTFPGLTFLLGERPWKPQGIFSQERFVQFDVPVPDHQAREDFWKKYLKQEGLLTDDSGATALASKFAFTPGQMRDAVSVAETSARWRSGGGVTAQVTWKDLDAACRAQCELNLGGLARKIEPKRTWDDIVLPPDQLSHLKEVCAHALHRHTVYGEWGFERKLSGGLGLNALFSGAPGTGKTLAAEVVAQDLRLDLYKIDLSQVVSKYIGETEKNLHQIFREAQSSGAILFFDEADALFGKRSEVKDAHDRFANIEISYLLQKMEEYDGIAVLATNLRGNMDEAFVRRMRFIIEFPFPDDEHRRRIWKVTFPPETPLASDVDFELLAREIRLAGGSIRNIALTAAFYAAESGANEVRMQHLIRAARREFQKVGLMWKEI
ncbi:MAG TPA: AAA family ATPase [Pyrinomonadaceae bacterium]